MHPLNKMKRLVIGVPRHSSELTDQTLSPWLGFPVFAADTISSAAYATEETMVVLALAGTASLSLVWPLSGLIAVLVLIVIAGYRQTVRAYPQGGGAYHVARANLGERAGLTAAAALMIDYTLTVAVSVAAGTAAVISAVPELSPFRLIVAGVFLAAIATLNLRGLRDASFPVAVLVYGFLAVMAAMIGVGVWRCTGTCPSVPFEQTVFPSTGAGLTVFLALRAFATASTSLAGVEAVSNGVAAFEKPRARNAATALTMIALIIAPLFAGIAYLAVNIPGIVVYEGVERTVTSQIASAVFGNNSVGFYAVQVATAAILFLAANTGFADFPRLTSALAHDLFLPRTLARRGDRLVYSNGIVLLTVAAGLLLVMSGARVTFLVGMYVVGVFTAFTISQAGMVRHWLREQSQGWRLGLALNTIGACTTGTVLLIVLITKFWVGAWVVALLLPLLIVMMHQIRVHYARFNDAISVRTIGRQPPRDVRAVIAEDRVDAATAAALSYGYGIGARSVEGVLVPSGLRRSDTRERWRKLAPDIAVREQTLSLRVRSDQAIRIAAREAASRHPEAFTMTVVPQIRSTSLIELSRDHTQAQKTKNLLVTDATTVVANVVSPPGGPGPYQVAEPVEHHVVVLINRLHDAALTALALAESLQASSVQALAVNLSSERSTELLSSWQDLDMTVPLDLIDSPYRSVPDSVIEYINDEFAPDGQYVVVTVIVSEFMLSHWWQRWLHNQGTQTLKRALLFQRGVVTLSVPVSVHLSRSGEAARDVAGLPYT